MTNSNPFDRHPKSVPGDFYVENGYCLSCGVPESIAPDLIGRTEDDTWHCYWKKQPETQEELSRAISILHSQELDCHRYAGSDRTVLKKLPRNCCDVYAPATKPTELDFSKGRTIQLLPQQKGGWLSKLLGKIAARRHQDS